MRGFFISMKIKGVSNLLCWAPSIILMGKQKAVPGFCSSSLVFLCHRKLQAVGQKQTPPGQFGCLVVGWVTLSSLWGQRGINIAFSLGQPWPICSPTAKYSDALSSLNFKKHIGQKPLLQHYRLLAGTHNSWTRIKTPPAEAHPAWTTAPTEIID